MSPLSVTFSKLVHCLVPNLQKSFEIYLTITLVGFDCFPPIIPLPSCPNEFEPQDKQSPPSMIKTK